MMALAAAVVLAGTWVGGLFLFTAAIPSESAAIDDGRETDAIVVLTGGTMRLESGLALLAQGRARKLFVSGVHRGVDVQELLRVSRQSPQSLDCCIALGYLADDTRGNAAETAEWMRRNQFRSLRLVTASYHMPRSLVEFRSHMDGVAIVPHPVFPAHVKLQAWWRWPGTAALVIAEYHKYVAARGLALLRRVAPALSPVPLTGLAAP